MPLARERARAEQRRVPAANVAHVHLPDGAVVEQHHGRHAGRVGRQRDGQRRVHHARVVDVEADRPHARHLREAPVRVALPDLEDEVRRALAAPRVLVRRPAEPEPLGRAVQLANLPHHAHAPLRHPRQLAELRRRPRRHAHVVHAEDGGDVADGAPVRPRLQVAQAAAHVRQLEGARAVRVRAVVVADPCVSVVWLGRLSPRKMAAPLAGRPSVRRMRPRTDPRSM